MMHSPLEAFDRRNLLTYTSLVCGVLAVAAARAGAASAAGGLLALAVIADTFDGRFAQLFRSSDEQRHIGTELDSLADAIAFGMAPPLCASLLTSTGGAIAALWWMAMAGYAACAITRLAFFNVHAADGERMFVGVPVPVAALLWSSALLASPSPVASIVVATGCAAAMVAPLRIPRPTGAGLALFTCWPVIVVLAHVGRLLHFGIP